LHNKRYSRYLKLIPLLIRNTNRKRRGEKMEKGKASLNEEATEVVYAYENEIPTDQDCSES
jgi:hypothetical protein